MEPANIQANHRVVIASRQSQLAKIQTQAVGAMLQAAHPTLQVTYLWVESEGDKRLDIPLANAGAGDHATDVDATDRSAGKGLFAKAVEQLLMTGEADVAVHSLKDVPVAAVDGLSIVAIPTREDVRDVLISHAGVTTIGELPRGATIGTASPRRAAQLKMHRPDVSIGLLRGNVQTRIGRVVDERQFDATLLAAAGLRRLGLDQWLAGGLATDEFLPAASQGALGVQCRTDDERVRALLAAIHDEPTAQAVGAERRVVEILQGNCHSPIGALGVIETTGEMRLQAGVWSEDGSACLRSEQTGAAKDWTGLAERVGADLRSQGSDRVLGHAGT